MFPLLFELLPNNEFPYLLLLLELALPNNPLELFQNKTPDELLPNKPILLILEGLEAKLVLCKLLRNKNTLLFVLEPNEAFKAALLLFPKNSLFALLFRNNPPRLLFVVFPKNPP